MFVCKSEEEKPWVGFLNTSSKVTANRIQNEKKTGESCFLRYGYPALHSTYICISDWKGICGNIRLKML